MLFQPSSNPYVSLDIQVALGYAMYEDWGCKHLVTLPMWRKQTNVKVTTNPELFPFGFYMFVCGRKWATDPLHWE